MRDNDLLEEALSDSDLTTPTKKGRKRRAGRRAGLSRDGVKRRAFRVLAVISDLDKPTRKRVLAMANRLSEV